MMVVFPGPFSMRDQAFRTPIVTTSTDCASIRESKVFGLKRKGGLGSNVRKHVSFFNLEVEVGARRPGITSSITALSKKGIRAVLTEAWVASDEAITIAAAEEAMALARAAVKAARDAMNPEGCLLIDNDIDLRMDWTTTEEPLQISEASHNAFIGDVKGISSGETALPPPKANVDVADAGSNVVVSTSRHKERVLKRKKAFEKSEKAAMSVSNTSVHKGKCPQSVSYCKQIRRGRVPNFNEEMMLVKGYQELRRIEKVRVQLLEQFGREPALQEWASALGLEYSAFAEVLKEARQSKERLISANLGLVVKIAKKFHTKGFDLEDLIQEGIFGLLTGAERFDLKRGLKLSTYAHWWIQVHIRKVAVKHSTALRVPMHLYDVFMRVNKARRTIQDESGQSPSDAEVAQHLGLTVERVRLVCGLMRPSWSLHAPIPHLEDTMYLDVLPDDRNVSSLHSAERNFMTNEIEKILDQLNPRDREIIVMRFGLDGQRCKTLAELGSHYNLSRERIRQIEARAMRTLKETSMQGPLKSYAETFISGHTL